MMAPSVGSIQNMRTLRGTPRSTTVLSLPVLALPVKPYWLRVGMLPPVPACPDAICRVCWAWTPVVHRHNAVMMPTNILRMAPFDEVYRKNRTIYSATLIAMEMKHTARKAVRSSGMAM